MCDSRGRNFVEDRPGQRRGHERLAEEGEDAALEAIRGEMRSTEQRLVSDMRENIQVLASGLQGLRTQLTQLNASVNDLMQRFVNIERRVAQHEQRIERLGG